jgi:hypothetical protein
VRRAAVASGHQIGDEFDAEAWWHANGDGDPLGYSSLLERLGSTRGARRALLAGFFEPDDDDRDAGRKVPGPAHKAIATLVRKGLVRVIVTTNFDRLIERALEAEGISPQVISSDTAVGGMEPIQHMTCTILKLHGDYASLDQRNTVDELSSYPVAIENLLARIFDEFGLIVSGWSGDWDPALVQALEASANRRYPLYWTSRSALGDTARRLTARNGVHVVPGVTADDFFPDLVARVDAIESMSFAPESLNAMVARLKRALPDPVRHIEVRDLLDSELTKLSQYLHDYIRGEQPAEWAAIEVGIALARERTNTLIHLLTTGIMLDRDRHHTDLWVWTIERAMNARPVRDTQDRRDLLAHYPALLLLRSGTIAAVLAGHDDVARAILQRPKWSSVFHRQGAESPAWDVLDPSGLLERQAALQLPRFKNGPQWHRPVSHMLYEDLDEVVRSLAGVQDTTKLHSRAEYRAALAWQFAPELEKNRRYPTDGDYIGDYQWTHDETPDSVWALDFRANGDMGAWGRDETNPEWFDAELEALRKMLYEMRGWRN